MSTLIHALPRSSLAFISLCFFASPCASSLRSCTFSATNSALYFVIVYWGASLCTFIFLRAPLDCKIVILSGLDSIFSIMIVVFGMSPPTCPSYIGMLSFLYVTPLTTTERSFCCVIGFGIAFFFIVSLPPVCFVRPSTTLLFAIGVIFFGEGPSSVGCLSFAGCLCFSSFLYFFGSTRSFHSSF